jgi:hypothetical protein
MTVVAFPKSAAAPHALPPAFRPVPAPAPSWSRGFLAAASAAPIAFERLIVETGSGLAVRIRTLLGRSRAPRAPASAGGGAAQVAETWTGEYARTDDPVPSTAWIERRGLEGLSASETAATRGDSAAPASSSASPARPPSPEPQSGASSASNPGSSATAPAPVSGPARIPPLVCWALFFLPAAFLLLKDIGG